MVFRFKQFSVQQKNSAFKIGTDSVLLGAWARVETARQALDIGSGCGVLALMVAQRNEADVTAVELDSLSAEEARENFQNSPWTERLTLLNTSIQEFANTNSNKFDLIISNPPYFEKSLPAKEARKTQARHNHSLQIRELAFSVSRLLSENGTFAIVLPTKEAALLVKESEQQGVHLIRKCEVFPTQHKPSSRWLMEFGFMQKELAEEKLVLNDHQSRSYTPEHQQLTRDFYLNH